MELAELQALADQVGTGYRDLSESALRRKLLSEAE